MNYKRDKLFSSADVFIDISIGSDANYYIYKYDYSHLDANVYFDRLDAQRLMREYTSVRGRNMVYWVKVFNGSSQPVKLTRDSARVWAKWYHGNSRHLKKYTID